MNKFIAFVTWPFRTVANYVDQNPTGDQIRKHAGRQELVVDTNKHGTLITLGTKNTDSVGSNFVLVPKEYAGTKDVTDAYIDGAYAGVKLMQDDVLTLRRRRISTDDKVLRDLRRAQKAEAKAAQAEAKIVDDLGAAGTASAV